MIFTTLALSLLLPILIQGASIPVAAPKYIVKLKERRPYYDTLVKAIIRDDEPAIDRLIIKITTSTNKKESVDCGYSNNTILSLGPLHSPNLGYQTALMIAALNGRTSTVKKLLRAGANPDLQNDQLHTALTLCNKYTDVFKALLEGGANPNVRAFKGNTALIYSIMIRNKERVALLMKHGADPRITNDDGFSAQWYAQEAGQDFVDLITPKPVARKTKRLKKTNQAQLIADALGLLKQNNYYSKSTRITKSKYYLRGNMQKKPTKKIVCYSH